MSVPAIHVASRLVRLMIGPGSTVRLDLIYGVCLEIFAIACVAAGPFALKAAVDLLGHPRPDLLDVSVAVWIFVLSWSLGSIAGTWRMVFTTRVINVLTRRLTVGAIAGYLPDAVAAKSGDSGRMLGVLERLPYSLQAIVDGLIWRTVPLLAQVVLSLGLIAHLIPPAYAVVLAVMFAAFVATTWVSAKSHLVHAQASNSIASTVSQTLGDVIRNARRVVLNGAIAKEAAAIGQSYAGKQAVDEKMMASLVAMAGFQFGVVSVGLLILLSMGSHDVISGRITVGDFVLLQAFAFRLILPLSGFGYMLTQAGVSFANIADAMDLQTRDSPNDSSVPEYGRMSGEVRIENVTFRYGPGLSGIQDVTAQFAPGSFNLIVGPNGSGKSTLAQIIAGILPPEAGRVTSNGDDIQAVPKAERYRHIMYVPQFVSMFNRSLGANALYPPSLHTERDLAALLYDWQFYESGREISLDLIVGEQGERLSGGQIQKLELARLAGVRVPVLILDESTSALDPRSEGRVIDGLRRIYDGRTTLILVTHRISLAEKADQVIFVKSGTIVAAGRHTDLLASQADYRDLWSLEDSD